MSRLWDTPEFWARSEADEMLREIPDLHPAAVADPFERSSANYDGGPELAAMIVADLRRRAAAGMRFWTGPRSTAAEAGESELDAAMMSARAAVNLDQLFYQSPTVRAAALPSTLPARPGTSSS